MRQKRVDINCIGFTFGLFRRMNYRNRGSHACMIGYSVGGGQGSDNQGFYGRADTVGNVGSDRRNDGAPR